MSGRVFIFRVVAAADMTAGFAKPQMNPTISSFQTVFATLERVRRRLLYLVEMRAIYRHIYLLLIIFVAM
jgi:hypothetical protein